MNPIFENTLLTYIKHFIWFVTFSPLEISMNDDDTIVCVGVLKLQLKISFSITVPEFARIVRRDCCPFPFFSDDAVLIFTAAKLINKKKKKSFSLRLSNVLTVESLD